MPLGHLVGSCSLQSASEPFIEEPKSQHLSWVVIYFQLLPFPKIWSQFEIFKKLPFNLLFFRITIQEYNSSTPEACRSMKNLTRGKNLSQHHEWRRVSSKSHEWCWRDFLHEWAFSYFRQASGVGKLYSFIVDLEKIKKKDLSFIFKKTIFREKATSCSKISSCVKKRRYEVSFKATKCPHRSLQYSSRTCVS